MRIELRAWAAVCCAASFIGGMAAPCVPGAEGTVVTVEQGRVELSNESGHMEVQAGESARMLRGVPPRAVEESAAAFSDGAPKNRPVLQGDPVPLDVRYDEAQGIVTVDGAVVRLGSPEGGERVGKDEEAGVRAVLSANGRLEIAETRPREGAKDARRATRSPDGHWTHEFGGQVMTVAPDGATTLLGAGGERIVIPPAGQAAPAAQTAPSPEYRWQLGVHLDKNETKKMVVSDVSPGSPAEKAGLKPGDEIVWVGNALVRNADAVGRFLPKQPRGKRIKIHGQRGGEKMDLTAVMGDWDE